MEYKIIDNALKDEDFQQIKNLLTSSSFDWYFQNSVDGTDSETEFYFTHYMFHAFTIASPHFNVIKPLLHLLDIKSLIRIKCNLYPNINKFEEHKFHKDLSFEHKGAIFYVNSNNGFTILEDGTKIESIENRVLLFDASKSHGSTNCTNQKARININFNYF